MQATIDNIEQLDDGRIMISATFSEGKQSETYRFPRDADCDVSAEIQAEGDIMKARFANVAVIPELSIETQGLIGTTIEVS